MPDRRARRRQVEGMRPPISLASNSPERDDGACRVHDDRRAWPRCSGPSVGGSACAAGETAANYLADTATKLTAARQLTR
jgi:hypothetical protein